MTKKEFLAKRKALTNEAQQLINASKHAEAKVKMDEIRKLDAEFENNANIQADLNALNGVAPAQFVNFGGDTADLGDSKSYTESEDMYATKEYRLAFMDFMTKGTPIPTKFTNTDYTTTSSGATVLVPTELYEKIYFKIEKARGIYARIFKTAYPAALLIPTAAVRPVASWVDEDEGSNRQKIDTDKVQFSGYKLECKVAISLFMSVTSLEKFESQFVEVISDAMIKSIEKAVISGSGEGAPTGILNTTTDNVINIASTDALGYDTIVAGEAALPLDKEDGAVWMMAKSTYTRFIGLTDDNGQPIASVNMGIDNKPQKALIGREVLLCDGLIPAYADTVSEDTTFAVIFNLADYVFNEVMGITFYRYVDNDNDNTVLKAVMLADGKVVDKDSLVKFVKKSN